MSIINFNRELISFKFARIVSTLFVPPSVALLILFYFAFAFESSFASRLTVISVTLIIGFILPIIVFFHLRKRNKIVDADATVKEERTLPFIIGIVLYSFGILILLYAEVNLIIVTFWFSYIINTSILIMINRYWKISVHALGVAGPLAALTYVSGWLGFSFIWLLIIVCWSRLKLRVHTPAQVMAGSVVGFLLTYLQMSLILGLYTNVL